MAALGLTVPQALEAVAVEAYCRGVTHAAQEQLDALARVEAGASVAEAVAARTPVRTPEALDLLLAWTAEQRGDETQ
jgi:hypothetical protein